MSVLGKLEEMVTCTSTVYIIGAIIAVKSCTILSSSFSRGGGCFPDAKTFIHFTYDSQTDETLENPTKTSYNVWIGSPAASLSCLRGYQSNMAPGTVKRAILLLVTGFTKFRVYCPLKHCFIWSKTTRLKASRSQKLSKKKQLSLLPNIFYISKVKVP